MLQHRILYQVTDEDGTQTSGRAVGSADVRQYAESLRKRFRDFQYIYCELEDSFDDGLDEEEEPQEP